MDLLVRCISPLKRSKSALDLLASQREESIQ